MKSMIGTWNFSTLKACNLPEKVATGFSEVFSHLCGAEYTPVLYCGTQLVHGINHMIICKMKVCHPDATEKLAKVIINEVPKTELESLWSIVTIQDIT